MFKTIRVPIGRSVGFDKKPIHIMIEGRGTLICEALPGFGKSAQVKNIIYWCRYYRRPVIVFDPSSEYFTMKYANFDNHTYMGGVSGMNVIKNFAFPAEMFDAQDLGGTGLKPIGVQVLNKVLHDPALRRFHMGDPEKIQEMVKDLPKDYESVDSFEKKYEYVMYKLHEATYTSLQSWIDNAVSVDMFWSSRAFVEKGTTNIKNVKSIVGRKCNVFDLDLRNSEEGKAKMRIYCAIILKQLAKIIEDMNPVIVFEEADKLAPKQHEFSDGPQPPISEMIKDYVLKKQKCGVFVILITQSEDLLNEELGPYAHQRLIGYLNEDSSNYHYVKDLRNDPAFGIRQFALVRYGKPICFEPNPTVCLDSIICQI
jgi:hypothetical protein